MRTTVLSIRTRAGSRGTSFSLLAFERLRVGAFGSVRDLRVRPVLTGQHPRRRRAGDRCVGPARLGQLPSRARRAGLSRAHIHARGRPAVGRPRGRHLVPLLGAPLRRDPADVLGRTIQVNRVPVTIVGVTPQGFDGAMQAGESPDVSVPLAHHLRFQPDGSPEPNPGIGGCGSWAGSRPAQHPRKCAASLEPIFQECGARRLARGTAEPASRTNGCPTPRRSPLTPVARARTTCGEVRAAAPHPHGPRQARAGWPRAPTSRTCCSHAAPHAAAKSLSASRSAHGEAASSLSF